MELSEILPDLSAWLPAEAHKERQIKGGGKWFYLPHTALRDRLNEVCPGHWSAEYDGPHLIDGEPVYHCRLTICGVTRTGIGDKSNESSNYGTAAQRSFRKAFTDAAEQFNLGAYLDEQSSSKTKAAFIKYMQHVGDGRAALNYNRNEGNLPTPRSPTNSIEPVRKVDPPKPTTPQDDRPVDVPNPKFISEAQRKRLYAIAIQEGQYTDAGFRSLVTSKGFHSSREITKAAYDDLCNGAKDPAIAAIHNAKVLTPA